MLTSGSASPAGARQLFPVGRGFLRSQQHLCPLGPGQQRVHPSSSQEDPQRLVHAISTSGSCPTALGCRSWGSPGPAQPRSAPPPAESPWTDWWILIPKAIWPLSASWETLPDPDILPAASERFCNEAAAWSFNQVPWKITFQQGSLCPLPQFRASWGVPRSSFNPDGEAWWSHAVTGVGAKERNTTAGGAFHMGTLAEGTPAPLGAPLAVREWGGFQMDQGSGHSFPSLPSNPSCGCS